MYSLTNDIGELIQIYYENIEIGNAEIKRMYPGISGFTIAKLKSKAREVMAQRNVMPWEAYKVNTECAYEAWQLNIADLEKRFQKLQKYKRNTGG